MKMADVLGGKLKGAKYDPHKAHRETLKRLLKLDDAAVEELALALRGLSEGDAEECAEPAEAGKRPSLLMVLKGKPAKGE